MWKYLSLSRGLRQQCPLSLSLYAIQGEATTTNISSNNLMKNIPIPNKTKETKNSQYTDDSNFFLKKPRISSFKVLGFNWLKLKQGNRNYNKF